MQFLTIICLIGLALVFSSPGSVAARLDVLVLTDSFPDSDAQFDGALQACLVKEGFSVKSVSGDSLKGELKRVGDRPRILVCPNASHFPLDSRDALVKYLEAGGNILTIGGAPFSQQAVKLDGKWATRDSLRRDLEGKEPSGTLIRMDKLDLSSVRLLGAAGEPEQTVQVVRSGLDECPSALEISIPKVSSWTAVGLPIQKPFAAQASAICFQAKGDGNLTTVVVACELQGGSAWRKQIELGKSWTRYVIPLGDLEHKRDSPKNYTRLLPEMARYITLSVEFSYAADPAKPFSFLISDVQEFETSAGNPDFTQPTLETLSPKYKCYYTKAAAYIPTHGSYVDLDPKPAITGEANTVCSVPRYRGMGFNKNAPYRWIPALAVKMADGHIGGAAAALYVQPGKGDRGSVWATFGVQDPPFIAAHRDEIAREATLLVKRIDDGLYLLSAGVDKASYFEGIPNAGAVIVDLAGKPISVEVECRITPEKPDNAKPVFVKKTECKFEGKSFACELGAVKGLKPGFYVCRVFLYSDNKLIDAIRQPFSIVESKQIDKKDLVTIKGDQFYYRGKPWYSLGINYRPVYVSALERGPFWEHWANPNQYDSEIIEIELDLMKKMGLNTVGLIAESGDKAPGLVDFMERANRYGIKIDMFVYGLHPLQYAPKQSENQIRDMRLWERPAMFAYDVAWEVRIGREDERQGADMHWKRWIEDRYGSVGNAEKDWEFTLRKDPDGRAHGPSDDQVSVDGNWRRMVAAYRRFWDDRISQKYTVVRDHVRSLDPYHPISARSGWAGTGSLVSVPQMPFDLLSGAKHLDFISPEGYNVNGPWPKIMQGGFTTLYAQFVSGGKPVYWAEFGSSVSNPPTPEALEKQRQFYENIYRVFRQSRAAGSDSWWWPGYLISENSDYACIHPDFTLRPSALEYKKMSQMMKSPLPLRPADHIIEIDRDLYANGYAGMLKDKRAEYGKAIIEGKSVALRTTGTGTDTSSFPKIAVGNTPLTGDNPPKFVNAEFNSLEILNSKGKWVQAQDGDTITVKAGSPVSVRASLGNISETKWLAPKGERPGGVYLRAQVMASLVLAPIAADTSFLSDAMVPAFVLPSISGETKADFQPITGKYSFGEKRIVTIVGR